MDLRRSIWLASTRSCHCELAHCFVSLIAGTRERRRLLDSTPLARSTGRFANLKAEESSLRHLNFGAAPAKLIRVINRHWVQPASDSVHTFALPCVHVEKPSSARTRIAKGIRRMLQL